MSLAKPINWSPHAGFAVAGCYLAAAKLVSSVTIRIWGDTTVLGEAEMIPDVNGAASQVLWFASAASPAKLSAEIVGTVRFSSPLGSILVEIAELQAYKPQPWDEYLVARCASANGSADPQGPDYTAAADIVPNLLKEGCLLGAELAIQGDSITPNPVYQAWRRLGRSMRIFPRELLLSYEVDGSGIATLRFKRALPGVMLVNADPWEGIAPPPAAIASGNLVNGETYIVRGATGAVTYAGTAYAPGVTFTAGIASGYTSTGDAVPWVWDGIKHVALKRGWSNEWVFLLQTHCYRNLETSIWKPSIYADFFTFLAPEHFYGPSSGSLREFVNSSYSFNTPNETTYTSSLQPAMVQATFINPEAPSAYTYASGANAAASTGFKQSRQVYPPPYEPDSCTLEFDGAGNQIVVLKLKASLRRHPNATLSFVANPTLWTTDDLSRLDGTHATLPEDFRTDENAVREYLRLQSGDLHPCSFKTGDCGAGGAPYPSVDGSCFPNFIFIKLVQECYEDANAIWDETDSRVLAETYEHAGLVLDTICEAFVAGSTSAERVCVASGDAGLYDYTRETLYFEAFGDRSLSAFPLALRPDRQYGFGPLPNTEIYADTHNRFSKAYNLLTRLRLDVPLLWETRQLDYTGQLSVTPTGNPYGYCDSLTRLAWLDGTMPAAANTLVTDSGWIAQTTALSIIGLQGAGLGCCGGTSNWCLVTSRTETQWRISIQPDWLYAVPQHIQDLVNVSGLGTVSVDIEQEWTTQRKSQTPSSICQGLEAPYLWDQIINKDNVQTCRVVMPGTLSVPDLGSSDYAVFKPVESLADCEYGQEHSLVHNFLAYPSAFLEVPLADLP